MDDERKKKALWAIRSGNYVTGAALVSFALMGAFFENPLIPGMCALAVFAVYLVLIGKAVPLFLGYEEQGKKDEGEKGEEEEEL